MATQLLAELAQALTQRGWMLATAESCTGGLIAAQCTELAGSSTWFERGFVTYSNEAKTDLLGVETAVLAHHGAVSEPVALAMAAGAIRHSRATLSVAVTGIAGPGGAVPGKPVGTVWLAWGLRPSAPDEQLRCAARLLNLSGNRQAVRQATVQAALQQLLLVARG